VRLLIVALFCGVAQPATAVVECVADAVVGQDLGTAKEVPINGAILRYRFEAIRNLKVAKAQLHLHISKGTVPAQIEIAMVSTPWAEHEPIHFNEKKLQYLPHKVEGKEEGWIQIDVEPSLIELLAAGKGTGLLLRDRTRAGEARYMHSRENPFIASYLVVEGEK